MALRENDIPNKFYDLQDLLRDLLDDFADPLELSISNDRLQEEHNKALSIHRVARRLVSNIEQKLLGELGVKTDAVKEEITRNIFAQRSIAAVKAQDQCVAVAEARAFSSLESDECSVQGAAQLQADVDTVVQNRLFLISLLPIDLGQ